MMARRGRRPHVTPHGTEESWQQRPGTVIIRGMTLSAAAAGPRPRPLLVVLFALTTCLAAMSALAASSGGPAVPGTPATAEPGTALVAAAPDATAPARPETTEPGYLERRWAGTDLTALAAALAAWRRDNGAWPADCPEAAAAKLSPAVSKDPWGTPYSCVLEDPPRVISAGPDRQLGSPDDLAYRLDGGGMIPSSVATASAGASASTTEPASSPDSGPAPPATDEAKSTTDRLLWMARALAAYRAREGRYPVADQAEHLEHWLVPTDLPPSQWIETDGWDRPWRYRVTDTGSSYSLSSAGADGRWEPLSSVAPTAVANADGDLVVADGVFLRWPAGFRPGTVKGASVSSAEPKASPEPKDPALKTAWRLEHFVAALELARKANGRYPESDDAPRVFAELGVATAAVDGWGRELDYLSQGDGAHFALVSRGKDGRAARSIEEYARGAASAGDDVILRR